MAEARRGQPTMPRRSSVSVRPRAGANHVECLRHGIGLRVEKRCRMRCIQIRHSARVGAMAVFVCLCVAPEVFTQTTRATLTGTVTDPNGAVVPGATVNATNVATNISSETQTNQVGTYTFTAL